MDALPRDYGRTLGSTFSLICKRARRERENVEGQGDEESAEMKGNGEDDDPADSDVLRHAPVKYVEHEFRSRKKAFCCLQLKGAGHGFCLQ